MGCCMLAGSAFSIQFSSRAMPIGRGINDRATQGKPFLLDSSAKIPD